MRRRGFLIGAAGTVSLGSVIGSGALTSASAARNATISVVGDADAYLGLSPCAGPNAAYVRQSAQTNGMLELAMSELNPTGPGGEGVNDEAYFEFHDVFEIANQGTQPVGVWLDAAPATTESGDPAVDFYAGDDPTASILTDDPASDAICLPEGESLCVGVLVRTTGVGTDQLLGTVDGGPHELIVHADATVGCSTTSQGA